MLPDFPARLCLGRDKLIKSYKWATKFTWTEKRFSITNWKTPLLSNSSSGYKWRETSFIFTTTLIDQSYTSESMHGMSHPVALLQCVKYYSEWQIRQVGGLKCVWSTSAYMYLPVLLLCCLTLCVMYLSTSAYVYLPVLLLCCLYAVAAHILHW